jgi:hypothetical protein
MRIRATVVKALAAGALLAGIAGVGIAGTASALSPFNYFASPTGTAANAPCTSKHSPCDLTTALSQEATNSAGNPGSVVHLAKGTYTETISLTSPGNDNVLIEGKKASTTLVPGGISFSGHTGVTVSNITLTSALAASGGTIAVENGALAAPGTGDVLNGSTISASGTAEEAVLNGGTTTLSNDNIVELTSAASCTTVSKASPSVANPGWTTPGFLNVKKVPKCATSAPAATTVKITTPGPATTVATTYTFPFTRSGPKALDLGNNTSPGGTNPAIPAGTTVVYKAAATPSPAYSTAGVAVSGGVQTITGGNIAGPTSSVASPGNGPVGISVSGGTANVTGVSVSGNVNTGTGNPGIGVSLSGGIGNLGAGVTTTGNDVGLLISASSGAQSVVGGSYSAGATGSAGVVIVGLGNAAIGNSATLTFTGNTISGSSGGAGLQLEGVKNTTLGSSTPVPPASVASLTNTVSGNAVGVAFGQLTAAGPVGGSTGNTLNNFNINNNLAFGVEVAGQYAPNTFTGGTPPTVASSGDSVVNSVFSNNGATGAAAGANIANFDSYAGPIDSTAGLVTTTDIPAGSTAPTTITLMNTSATPVTVANGEAITLAGEPQELYVDNGAGVSHVLAQNTSFTFTVNTIVPSRSTTTADIPVGTAVGQRYTTTTADDIGTLSGNNSGTGTSPGNLICNKTPNPSTTDPYEVNSPSTPLTAATTVNGGYFDC